MKRNLQHFDEIRFLMIHLILINHFAMSFFLIPDRVDQTLVTFWFEITSPILALLSGYLFFYGTKEHLHYGDKLKRRIPSLVIPYLTWSLGFYFIYYGIKLISAKFHMHFWYNENEPITISAMLESIRHPLLINFWYLQNLILIIPFNFLFYYILKNKPASIAFFLVILIILAYKLVPLYFESRFLPFYMMGCYAGYHKLHVPKLSLPLPALRSSAGTLASVFWVPLIALISLGTGFWNYEGMLLTLIKIAVVLFIFVSTWNLLDASPDSWVFRYLKKYKAHSFFVFAIHTFIFMAVQRPLFQLCGDCLRNRYFTLAFSIVTTIPVLIICLVLSVQTKRFFPRFYGVITGR